MSKDFSKYIVPIFSGSEYSGTGFLVNGLLITANHVVSDKLHSSFIYEGENYAIDICNLIVLESPEDIFLSENAYDLFVCKTEITGSNLEFATEIDEKKHFEYYGYSFDDDKAILTKDIHDDMELYRKIAITYPSCTKQLNCMSCRCCLKLGNSGGPIFQNNKIVGMLIRGIEHHEGFCEAVIMKSSYIMKSINESRMS